jgi:Putative bacterial sensory transduction regulator
VADRTAWRAAVATVERVLASHPDVASRRLDGQRWSLTLPGTVRWQVTVQVEVGPHTTVATSFLLRGPRPPHGDPAALHRLLLRKNLGTRRLHFALDGDDDVVLVARLPTAAISEEQLESVLAEILVVSDAAFEALVHLAYPGVFPPLPAGPRPGPGGPERS